MKPQLTIGEVLERLVDEDYIRSQDYQDCDPNPESKKGAGDSPWYVRLFVGLSAWIAAAFLLSFLFMADIITFDNSALFWGLGFCVIAVGINRFGSRNDFLVQLGLATSLAGQVLFTLGLSENFEVVITLLLLILLEICLILLYQDRLHRFISTLVIVIAGLALFFEIGYENMLHGLIILLGVGAVLLFGRENDLLVLGFDDLGQPVGYAVTLSMLGLLILPLVQDSGISWWWITAVLLVGLLVFLIFQIVKDLGLDMMSGAVPWLIAGCVVLLIPAVRMPGILGALIILILGFWRNKLALIGLAAVFLLFYLGAYYYFLEWTLLVKSFALLGTGAILFLLRFILRRYTPGGA